MDGHAAEGAAPLHHARIEVRMRDGDSFEPAKTIDQCDGRGIQHRDAVPQHVAGRRADEERTLADGKLRLRPDTDQTHLMLAIRVEMRRCQRFWRRPGLSAWRNILPLLFANRA